MEQRELPDLFCSRNNIVRHDWSRIMYETTPLPPKALKHYSQAPLLLICLVFFASPLLG